MATAKPDHENDRNRDHDNDNHEGGTVAPAPTGGALASLEALGKALNRVDMTALGIRSGKPMLQFKSREANGTWMFGQRRTIPEAGSLWAVNPLTFKWGYIAFAASNKRAGERLVSVTQPLPAITELPDVGAEWQKQMAVDMKCITGADAGTEVVFKISTEGGIQAVSEMVDTVRDRFNSGQHDGKVAPIVRLEKDSYQHSEHGRTWFPVLPVVNWMSLDGPPPASEPEPEPPQPEQQPRRRRVG